MNNQQLTRLRELASHPLIPDVTDETQEAGAFTRRTRREWLAAGGYRSTTPFHEYLQQATYAYEQAEADRRENRIRWTNGETSVIAPDGRIVDEDKCQVNSLLGSLVGLIVLLATGAFMATLFLNGGY